MSGPTGRSGRRPRRSRMRPSQRRCRYRSMCTGTSDRSGRAPRRGPSQARAYHPFNWRGWWDFGTGALGDMACHTANMAFMALKLGYAAQHRRRVRRGQPGDLSGLGADHVPVPGARRPCRRSSSSGTKATRTARTCCRRPELVKDRARTTRGQLDLLQERQVELPRSGQEAVKTCRAARSWSARRRRCSRRTTTAPSRTSLRKTAREG